MCVCIRARCLLPAGLNFSGAYLLDGDDRKHERLVMLVELMQDFDIVLLNEVCVCVCVCARACTSRRSAGKRTARSLACADVQWLQVWACKWSLSTHRHFVAQAIKSGFNVVGTLRACAHALPPLPPVPSRVLLPDACACLPVCRCPTPLARCPTRAT